MVTKTNKEEKFIQRCVEALKLADRVIDVFMPEAHPATHPAYAEIFKLAYQEIKNTEEE